MKPLSLLDDHDVQMAFSTYLRQQRKAARLSRDALAEHSTVPASTIKRFELSGQISFRQLLLLWQCLDDLQRLHALTQPQAPQSRLPTSIDEVLKDEF